MTAAGRRRAGHQGPRRGAPGVADDYGMEVVRFGSIYQGFVPYVSPAYPTRDHVIPAPLFDYFYRRIGVALALQRLNSTRAVGLGARLASGEVSQADVDAAFPEVPRDAR